MEPFKVVQAFKTIQLFDRAKKMFGVTRDYKRAGYVLPDGSLLDLSKDGKRQDHTTIQKIFQEDELEQDPEHYKEEGKFAQEKFIKAGAVRLVPESGGVEMMAKPTPAQLKVLANYFKNVGLAEIYIDLSGKGRDIKKMYDNTPEGRTQALDTIEDYFSGKMQKIKYESPLQQFRYADEKRRDVERV